MSQIAGMVGGLQVHRGAALRAYRCSIRQTCLRPQLNLILARIFRCQLLVDLDSRAPICHWDTGSRCVLRAGLGTFRRHVRGNDTTPGYRSWAPTHPDANWLHVRQAMCRLGHARPCVRHTCWQRESLHAPALMPPIWLTCIRRKSIDLPAIRGCHSRGLLNNSPMAIGVAHCSRIRSNHSRSSGARGSSRKKSLYGSTSLANCTASIGCSRSWISWSSSTSSPHRGAHMLNHRQHVAHIGFAIKVAAVRCALRLDHPICLAAVAAHLNPNIAIPFLHKLTHSLFDFMRIAPVGMYVDGCGLP